MLESDHNLWRPEAPAHTRCWVSVSSCLLLACFYVGSLYIWRSSLPVQGVPLLQQSVGMSLWELMGVRVEGFLPAAVLPLLLNMVLYLGPLVHSAVENADGFTGELQSVLDVQSWSCVKDAVWLRNQVVAPVTEELVFRVAMMSVLLPCTGPTAGILTAPLFFGVALFHHIIEQWHLRKENMSIIFLEAGIQFLYTTVFGAFAAFIILRTGHFVGAVLCHLFCNSQGLPDFTSALNHPHRSVLLVFYLKGVLLFLVLLFPLTDPFFYGAIPIRSLAPLQTYEC